MRTQDRLFGVKRKKSVPHEFVLEALAELNPRTNPMFGCLAVYVGEKIVLILRDKTRAETGKRTSATYRLGKKDKPRRVRVEQDNGVWLATTVEHHQSLRTEFPNMRSIAVFGKKVTGWQVLPADAPDFETAALRACQLVRDGDRRIGKVPKRKASRRA